MFFHITKEGTCQKNPEAFDGSFRLQSGEIITGGYFVEAGQSRYLYMDTEGLKKGGIFEFISENILHSFGTADSTGVEIEFIPNIDGEFDKIIWRESTKDPIPGERVYDHSAQDVVFFSQDSTRLKGRLLLPKCKGPHPVIVTVHGSGPVNRYGGTFHTFFLQHGMAVLAYDKRGYTTDPEAWQEPDFAELSADVAAAVKYISVHAEIDTNRIGLFASSQGGWVAPPATMLAPEVDFMIVRVGAALTAIETVLHEIRQEVRNKGLSGLDLDYAMDLRQEIYTLAMKGEPIAAADSLVSPYLNESWYQTAFGDGPVSELWSNQWWKWAQRNLAFTPVSALKQFEGPVLWFLAERDENVPLISTRTALDRAFSAAPGDDHEIIIIDDAPHSFIIEAENGAPWYTDGFFSYMNKWLTKHGFSDNGCWQK